MADLLIDLHGETGATIVIVSHDPDEVARLAGDVLFLDRGRIIFEGPHGAFVERGDIEVIGRFLGHSGG